MILRIDYWRYKNQVKAYRRGRRGNRGSRSKRKDLNSQLRLSAFLTVVEAKGIERFSDANFAQLNSYLHFSGFEVGLFINFHNWPLKDGGIKHLVNTKD